MCTPDLSTAAEAICGSITSPFPPTTSLWRPQARRSAWSLL